MGGLTGMFVAVPTIAVVMAVTGAVLDVLGTTGTARVSVPGDIPAWLDRLAQWSWRLLVAVGLIGLARRRSCRSSRSWSVRSWSR